ncbi:MAG TPA: hypothetical protein VKA01_04110 [Vicinamibacteria bacterium]|nr:hypothetical protein [Vicinamibacteria bacterium]
MRLALAALALLAGALEEPEAAPPLPEGNALVLRSMVGRQRAREDTLDRYTYDVTVTQEHLDGQGRVTKRESENFEVFYVKGLALRRRTARDARPLDAKAQAKEDADVREKMKKIREGRVAREQPSVRLSQILERYDFPTLSRELVDGRRVLLLEFQPLPGKRDLERDNVLRALQGRMLVDEADAAVLRADLKNSQGIKFALGLGASLRSLSLTLEFRRMEDGVWLPLRVETAFQGRIFLFKSFRRRQVAAFSNFRRFSADTEERYDTDVPR